MNLFLFLGEDIECARSQTSRGAIRVGSQSLSTLQPRRVIVALHRYIGDKESCSQLDYYLYIEST